MLLKVKYEGSRMKWVGSLSSESTINPTNDK